MTTPQSTLHYYSNQSNTLLDRYDNADMQTLHQLFLKYIPRNSKVLDIGFGSGRDLEFLIKQGYEVFGVDPTLEFIDNAKRRFSNIVNNFILDGLPLTKSSIEQLKYLDSIICVAVWMHLDKDQYSLAVKSMVEILNQESRVVISFSTGNRGVDDGRVFNEVDIELLTTLFNKEGFSLIQRVSNDDSLSRTSLEWITVVYQR